MVNQKKFHKPRSALTENERRVIQFPRPELPVVPDGERVAITGAHALDFPTYDYVAGLMAVVRPQRLKMKEPDWTKQIMLEHADWLSAVEMDKIDGYELEYDMPIYTTSPGKKRQGSQRIGFPRFDALLRHGDTVSILESKLEPVPCAVAGAVGQLLYYKSAFESHMKVKVDNLILATPFMPPALVDLICTHKLPIRVLKVTDVHFMGFVPPHLSKEDADAGA